MTDKNLVRITDLCLAFRDSVDAHVLQIKDSKAQLDILKSLNGDSVAEAKKMADLNIEVTKESFKYMSGSEPSDAFLKKNIALIEMTADICTRIMPIQQVSSFAPAELKNQTDADTLRSLGAPKLASLCEFKKK